MSPELALRFGKRFVALPRIPSLESIDPENADAIRKLVMDSGILAYFASVSDDDLEGLVVEAIILSGAAGIELQMRKEDRG
jgi:hypothetical protein